MTPASVVRTVATSTLGTPLPDPAGVTYLAARDHFLLSDSEVDETPVFQGADLIETTRLGEVVDRGQPGGGAERRPGAGTSAAA